MAGNPTTRTTNFLQSLPPDLIQDHILSRLTYHSLQSCQLTCHYLNHLITSSTLIAYMKELEMAGMNYNPFFPHGVLSLPEKRAFLRKYQTTWKNMNWKWHKSADEQCIPPEITSFLCAGAGVIYFKCGDPTFSLKALKLPTKEADEFIWEDIHVGKRIVASVLSVTDGDLLAFTTLSPISPNNPIHAVQIELLTHSSHLPHPDARNTTLDLFVFDLGRNSFLYVDMAVCGSHLAIMFRGGYSRQNDFIVTNWTTGETIFSRRMSFTQSGMVFLREDFLVVGNPDSESLTIYHILTTNLSQQHKSNSESTSTGKVATCQCRPIRKLHLPKTSSKSKYSMDKITFHLGCSSSISSALPTLSPNSPIVLNPLSSILAMDCLCQNRYGGLHSFLFILHLQTLLQHALQALASSSDSPEGAAPEELTWEAWAPNVVRMFDLGYVGWESESYCERDWYTKGSKLYMLRPKGLEVLDFKAYDSELSFAPSANMNNGNGNVVLNRAGNPGFHSDADPDQITREWGLLRHAFDEMFDVFDSGWPDYEKPFTNEVCTRLSYVSQMHWNPVFRNSNLYRNIYVDEHCVVCLQISDEDEARVVSMLYL